MNLRDIPIKRTYSSDNDDILNDFYIPILKASKEYFRLAGFFSSKSLAISARGISGLLKNGGNMKLIASPKLNIEDVKVILNAYKNPEKWIEKKLLEELETLDDLIIKDHVSILGWMIANKKLELKVAIVYDEKQRLLSYEEIQEIGLFHQKVGILRDSWDNIITFSGSVNETSEAWLQNIEEIKVFRNWFDLESEYVKADIDKFNRFWENQSVRIKVIDLPLAVKNKLIKIAPIDIDCLNLEKWYSKQLHISNKKDHLFEHQKKAIDKWLENGMRGIFEMATGSGKTFTALGCLNEVLKLKSQILIIITVPYKHLIQQWIKEIDNFPIEYDELIVADSNNPLWKDKLSDTLIDIEINNKNKVILLTTHSTFSSNDFINIIKNNGNLNLFLIGDEVHGLGSKKRRNSLIEKFNIRLGLSATPQRWFDSEGTKVLSDYFGGVIFNFNLKDAIIKFNPLTGHSYLTPYRYIPFFVSLTEKEIEEYYEMTLSIVKRFNNESNETNKEKILECLIYKRANLIKNAAGKYKILENILDSIKDIEYTIIFSTPQQIDEVMRIMNLRGITAHRFTMEEGTAPRKELGGISERDYILNNFINKNYKVLVAMKCLDEGVDIPLARTAILMASSVNPREYVQRIGRIIRRCSDKNESTIYDIIVIPSFNIAPEFKEIELNILNKELRRYEEIAEKAINSAHALDLIYKIKNNLQD